MKNTMCMASLILFVASLVFSQPTGRRSPQDGQNAGKAREQAEQDGFVQIPAGEFMMGSEKGADDESPVHKVRISGGLEMGKYEVTQAQWVALMGNNPSAFKGASLPVQIVTWHDTQAFIKKMNEKNDGYEYRLPSEAEWEYASRTGNKGESPADIDSIAWFYENSGGRIQPVGTKRPNAWGVYDLPGNVWEWCQDWYSETYYSKSAVLDPMGPGSGELRVVRRGSFLFNPNDCRYALRTGITPAYVSGDLGFRLVRRKR